MSGLGFDFHAVYVFHGPEVEADGVAVLDELRDHDAGALFPGRITGEDSPARLLLPRGREARGDNGRKRALNSLLEHAQEDHLD